MRSVLRSLLAGSSGSASVEAPFKAINVKGGMIAWQRAGLPMEGTR
ncbi:hypothetical protein [Arenimonas caeni]|nr:hypothetical protein [Arenimonas caeni]